MKAIQLRSPLNLSYVSTDASFTSLELSIFINSDVTAIDTTTTPDYFLLGEPIGLRLDFEIAELIRSKNNYSYKSNFYATKDTATYVLIRAVLLDDSGDQIEVKYNLIKVRDGYVDRNEVQLLNSEISPNINTWNANENVIITNSAAQPFAGINSYFVTDEPDSQKPILKNILQVKGIYTLSFFILGFGTIEFGKNLDDKILVDITNGFITGVIGNVISYDIFKVGGGFYKVSVVQDMILGDQFRISKPLAAGDAVFRVFNPTIIKGNLLNFTPTEVLLQSNNTIYDFIDSTNNGIVRFLLDRKESVAYNVISTFGVVVDLRARFISSPLITSFNAQSNVIRSFFIINETTFFIKPITCETKYTPAKVSFINKFGVIQDLVFFKKRVDTFNTSQQDFKANILRNGTYLPHTGQKQIISKTASAEVKLNTGFYPEDFNEVFKQLVYSTSYWINDEPAILKSTNFFFKTSVNDKLIDYAFDFEYANPDINDIR